MSSRPRRACTLPQKKPVLSDILESAYESTDTQLYEAFKAVCKYYKEDTDKQAKFWLKNTDGYDLSCREHQQLLSRVFEHIGTKHLLSIDYLHSMTKEQVYSLGLTRVIIPNHIFYRTRTGALTSSSDSHDYDDYYKHRNYDDE